jgi:uncharacterized RDD family membrane protein YckC
VAWFIDVLLLGMVLIVGLIVVAAAAPSVVEDATTVNLLSAILVTGLTFLYFVGLWTSSGGATVGMRLLALRIVRATDGGTLDIVPAIIRWVAFGYVFTVLTVLPGVSVVSNWLLTGWTIVLLLTTAMSAVNQGIHDRWAGSAVVRRADARTSPALVGCLAIALVLLVLVILLPILALIAVAPQLEEILSEVGQSI